MRHALVVVLLSSVAYAQTPDVPPPARSTAPDPAPVFAPPPPAPPPPVPLLPPATPGKQSPYALRLDVDLSLLILGTTLWGGTSFIGGGSTPPPWCGSSTTDACNPASVNALDRTTIGLYDTKARLAANVMVGVVPGAFTILDIVDAGVTNWKSWLTDAVVITEAVVWSGAVQDIVRRSVRRPRPYMYTPGLNPAERDGAEADFSFFSGHTSNTFAMVTAAAFTYTLRHPHSKWRWLVWSLAVAGETTEPVLRVLAGDHFPTDCIVGALVGTSAGILFPALHRRRVPIRVVSSAGPSGSSVGVAGAF
ncbi:MAG: Membrane-associated phospholipid phosphatase [bacterium]|nr:Membrane-associated phospholipid phosphatase [bacterium]